MTHGIRIGFTGTREGMTEAQAEAFRIELRKYVKEHPCHNSLGVGYEFHHGACVGSDERAVLIGYQEFVATYVAHPSELTGLTSITAMGMSGRVYGEMPPLLRNQDIVDAVEILFATPKTDAEEKRSGTWATVRMARKKPIPVIVIGPTGKVRYESPKEIVPK